ncbi:Slx4p interacting protein [Cadophora gregata]|uniref:Slx4p interacting protein n=1 Tax=Cadophora gregata TaxID=51156 RepID=UPI0026DD5658|nr:Slx4p interacting protein [Cadophora gregata]KAK0117782.1 Slx4p interacting protein [Cadophora gregata]KAK0122832.1 Slx4p interacting protein [Cadophora gregata f. sp. sojae]
MAIDRPIPAFYCCYLLRSTIRGSSVYVGSTPNPVRRLRQHNGLAKGGAARTSRPSMRPWEMTCIVTGFPSHIAALQFEWAWQNPHITTHIPSDSRIQHAVGKKRSGQPKRPRHTVSSLLSNLQLLLRVSSFARWPLSLHFFSPDVYKAWTKWCKSAAEPIQPTIHIIQDFPPTSPDQEPRFPAEKGSPRSKRQKLSHGIEALEVGYETSKAHVEKAKNVFDFEQEGSCAICHDHLEHDAGVYTICPTPGCQSVTHITCLSKHFLKDTEDDFLLPIKGTCPSCNEELRWVDVVKELSLRMRGQKEVENLLKVRRSRKGKGTSSQAIVEDSEEEDDDLDDDDVDEEIELHQLKTRKGKGKGKAKAGKELGDTWHALSESSDSDTGSITSTISHTRNKPTSTIQASSTQTKKVKTVIEDSDWDDADIID